MIWDTDMIVGWAESHPVLAIGSAAIFILFVGVKHFVLIMLGQKIERDRQAKGN